MTHRGNDPEGSLHNQPSGFHEQRASSFGKPLLHHATVEKETSSLGKQGLTNCKRPSLLDRTITDASWKFQSQAKNSLAVIKAKQILRLSATAGVALELLAFSLPPQGTQQLAANSVVPTIDVCKTKSLLRHEQEVSWEVCFSAPA